MMFLYSVRKLLSYKLLFIFILTFSLSAKPNNYSSIVNVFKSSINSVERRELLVSLKDFTLENGEEAPGWMVELLGDALNDKNPVVVAEAAYQIGQFKVKEYNSNLIQLFKDADSKYLHCGYAERIKFSIIPSLGKIGNQEAKQFISELLRNDNGSYMGQFLLEAVKNLNDPMFINDLKLYKYKMQNLIKISKEKKHDPIIYSRKLMYLEFSAEIEKVLRMKGGK